MKIMALEEAARFLWIKPSALKSLALSGRIPFIECKNKCCMEFKKRDLEDWLSLENQE